MFVIFGDKHFTNPIEVVKAFNKDELKKAFERIEQLKQKFFLVGYVRYEAFEVLEYNLPLLYFEVFDKFELYTPSISCPLEEHFTVTPLVNFTQYSNAIKKIKEEISCGNTYEVNYTYDFEIQYNGNDFKLFEYLLQKQKTPYNFFMKNEYDMVLSFSPELFFKLKNNHIITKPMKGTIHRGKTAKEDEKLIDFLKNDEKNRAENVMIVDLLRNDLGKIGKTGSVKVSKLFEIETHKTLHQMTSQIEADLREDVNLYDIFKAIFPCGSITGAPKISTMKVIKDVENGTRDIYCGAIGMISPNETVFSVPIRILQKSDKNFKYRVGGAIVWDSQIQDEWEETLTKTKFLNEDFQIVETIKIENGKLIFGDEHVKRMAKSAEFFGINFSETDFSQYCSSFEGILRILLDKNGKLTIENKPLLPCKTNKITISPLVVNSKNDFIYHKTTYRPWFFESYQKIKAGEIYDEIFFNEKGELTEGARSNIIIEINGKLYTPPISCGILDGIGKKHIPNLIEKVLYKKDLEKADKIFCVNSVRGMVEVHL